MLPFFHSTFFSFPYKGWGGWGAGGGFKGKGTSLKISSLFNALPYLYAVELTAARYCVEPGTKYHGTMVPADLREN